MTSIGDILLITAIPAGTMAMASVVSLRRSPGSRARSAMQHFASGIVFAAVATELVPDMVAGGRILPMLTGFILGVGLVLGIRVVDERGRSGGRRAAAGLLASTAVDLLIDGFLVGIGFGLSMSSGWLLVIAITFEVLFVGLSLAMILANRGLDRVRASVWLCVIGLLVPIGAVAGVLLFEVLDGDWQIGILAFGSAALLYLVTEELLVEAHDQGETVVGTSMFFVGFGSSLVLSMMLGH